MSTGSITTSGLGSGIDIEGLLEKMREVEARSVSTLETRKTIYEGTISAYDIVKTSINSLNTALGQLLNPSLYDARSAVLTNAKAAGVTVTKAAEVGSYKLDIKKLAEAQKVVTKDRFEKPETVVGEGKLTISLGSYDSGTNTFNSSKTVDIDIDSSNNTLSGIRDAINASDSGVTATIVNDGKGNRLVLTSKETGEENAFTVDVTGGTGDLNKLAYTPVTGGTSAMDSLQVAQDAEFTIDGIEMTSKTNTVDFAIKGMTITLQETEKTTITVSQTTDGLKESIQSFVNAYNEMNTVYRESMKYDKESDTAGALNGETAMRSFMDQMRRVVGNTVDNIPGGAKNLTEIGITFAKDGSLSIDNEKLDKALADPGKNVGALFRSTGTTTTKGVTFVSAASSLKAGKYEYDLKRDASGVITGTINGQEITVNGNQVSAGGITLLFEDGQTELKGSMYYTDGTIAKMRSTIDTALSDKGSIGRRIESLGKMVEDVDDRVSTLNSRINMRMDRLRLSLNNMDIYLQKMDSLSQFLSQKLTNNNSK